MILMGQFSFCWDAAPKIVLWQALRHSFFAAARAQGGQLDIKFCYLKWPPIEFFLVNFLQPLLKCSAGAVCYLNLLPVRIGQSLNPLTLGGGSSAGKILHLKPRCTQHKQGNAGKCRWCDYTWCTGTRKPRANSGFLFCFNGLERTSCNVPFWNYKAMQKFNSDMRGISTNALTTTDQIPQNVHKEQFSGFPGFLGPWISNLWFSTAHSVCTRYTRIGEQRGTQSCVLPR